MLIVCLTGVVTKKMKQKGEFCVEDIKNVSTRSEINIKKSNKNNTYRKIPTRRIVKAIRIILTAVIYHFSAKLNCISSNRYNTSLVQFKNHNHLITLTQIINLQQRSIPRLLQTTTRNQIADLHKILFKNGQIENCVNFVLSSQIK